MKPNFSGYVSRANIKCSDGRTILPGAFKGQSGETVPLVYQHNHTDIKQVLGRVELSHRDDGTWGDAFLNSSESAIAAGEAVMHGDLDQFSIWAKHLDQRMDLVHDGVIQEVSLVLRGANPGANIYNVLRHGMLDDDDNLMAVTGEIIHEDSDDADEGDDGKTGDDATIGSVLATLTPEQITAVNHVIDETVTEAVTEALAEDSDIQHHNLKEHNMARNAFESQDKGPAKDELKHADVESLLAHARTTKVSSIRDLIRGSEGQELLHADTYGVQNVELLFPDAKDIAKSPTFVDHRQEWVKTVMAGVQRHPFARIRTAFADITGDEARALGYVKGNQKFEEVFPVLTRKTGPTMIYKKQKIDRQDLIDVVNFDLAAWVKAEMRGKMDQEMARAIVFGDGRAITHRDKISEPSGPSGDGFRSIANDDSLYSAQINVTIPATPTDEDWLAFHDTVLTSAEDYLGSGNTTMFMSFAAVAKQLTMRDGFNQRMYKNVQELADAMDVRHIQRVPSAIMPADTLGILVDIGDYAVGTDAGGQLTLFDDFDIDFNQHKYLLEAYASGALTLPYSAQIFKRVTGAATVTPKPATSPTPNVVVIPASPRPASIFYTVNGATVSATGATITLTEDNPQAVVVVKSAGVTLAGTTTWTFTYDDPEA